MGRYLNFDMIIFIILFFVCFPLAIAYVVLKSDPTEPL